MSTPQSTIYVCSGVRLDSRYTHTIFFDSVNEQRAYFMSKVVKQFSTYSYIRRSWNIKLQATMEQSKSWNYLFFHNGESGKWYYYFINSIEYVNDNTVELTLEMDVMQTYLPSLDYKLLPCFIERQHTKTDAIGDNTVPENLELGELASNGHYKLELTSLTEDGNQIDLTKLCILMMATQNPQTGTRVLASRIHGVFNGVGLYAVSIDKFARFGSLLKDLDKDVIISMWMYPEALVTIDTVEAPDGWEDENRIVHTVAGVQSVEFTVKKDKGLNGYTDVKNKKLFTYPFNFLYMTNNNGTSAMYQYERFKNDVCEFKVTGALSPDACIRLDPEYYNGQSLNYDEGLVLDGFPSCAWDVDAYKIWLASNQNQNKLATGMAGLSMVGGVLATAFGGLLGAGAGGSMFVSGASQIASMLAQKKDMQIQPPQSRGAHSASVNVANGYHTFTAIFKSVSKETARIIDDYFSMYGYRINAVQTPCLNARNHYTYIKTIDCQIQGQLCNEDIVKIESIFDKGITFWKRGDEVAEYGLANTNIPV